MAGELRQIYVGVSDDCLDVLEAVVFVRRLRAVQELVRPVVEQLAKRLAEDVDVRNALEARRRRDAKVASEAREGTRTLTVGDRKPSKAARKDR